MTQEGVQDAGYRHAGDGKRAIYLRSTSGYVRDVIARSYSSKSRLNAIRAKCFECYGFCDVREIANCPATECPLWEYLPYRAGRRA